MRTSLRSLAALGATAMLSLAFAQAPTPSPTRSDAMGAAPAASGPSEQLKQGMMGGMRQMQVTPTTGDVDTDFVRLMRMHHLQGIEMARTQLAHGDSPEARRIAQKIIEGQQKEIQELDAWLEKNR